MIESIKEDNITYILKNYESLEDYNKEQIDIVLESKITFDIWAHKYAEKFSNLKKKGYSKEKIKDLLFNNK